MRRFLCVNLLVQNSILGLEHGVILLKASVAVGKNTIRWQQDQ